MKTLLSFLLGFVVAILGTSMSYSHLTPEKQLSVHNAIDGAYTWGRIEANTFSSQVTRLTSYVGDVASSEFALANNNDSDGVKPKLQAENHQNFRRELNRSGRQYDVRVAELVYVDSDGWSATLDSGIVLNLGQSNMKQRFERYLHSKNKFSPIANQKIVAVDARYEHGLAITWKKEESDGSQTTRE